MSRLHPPFGLEGQDRPLLENDVVTVRGKVERFGSPEFDDQIDSELERELDVFPGVHQVIAGRCHTKNQVLHHRER